MFPRPFIPMALPSQDSTFPRPDILRLYISQALHYQDPLFLHSQELIFPGCFIPRILYFSGPFSPQVLRMFWIFSGQSSHIPTFLCSKSTVFPGSIFRWPYIAQRALSFKGPIFLKPNDLSIRRMFQGSLSPLCSINMISYKLTDFDQTC